MRRDRRFELVLTAGEHAELLEAAEREGLSVAALLRRCFRQWAEVDRVIRVDVERERRVSAELHAGDPTLARLRDWDRTTEGRGQS